MSTSSVLTYREGEAANKSKDYWTCVIELARVEIMGQKDGERLRMLLFVQEE